MPVMLIIAGLILFFYISLFFIPSFRYRLFIQSTKTIAGSMPLPDTELNQMKQKASMLERNVSRIAFPGNSFLIINTTHNTFYLYRNREMIANGLCSTGSLIHLEVDSLRSWMFETPKGLLRVKNKIIDPVWHKPDWAFIEEGMQPPPPGHPSRYEKGVLGDYALDLGNGYLIHGTIYQRLLGMSVTHGCVRMKDSDLELVFNTLEIGSKVYIF